MNMQLTINRIRELLFSKSSEYCKWNKKGGKSAYDPFLGLIFGFLDSIDETNKAFQQILNTESSHDNFCRGKLRSDGYYPVKSINEWIYADLSKHCNSPDNSLVIQELQSGYSCLSGQFSAALTEDSSIFKELLTLENCFGSKEMYAYIHDLLNREEYLLVLSWMTVIAIFPPITSVTSKKPDYAQLLLKSLFNSSDIPKEAPSTHNTFNEFLKEKLAISGEIEEIVIVRNYGVRELMSTKRNTLIQALIERASNVKILITEPQIAEEFTEHIRRQNKIYLSNYMSPVLMWADFCKKFPGKVILHLSPVQSIHQYTEIKFKDCKHTASFVGIYTYGDKEFDEAPFMIIPYESAYYRTFRTEFEYSWNISHSYSENHLKTITNFSSGRDFIKNGIDCNAKTLDFAFHAGAEWLMMDEKLAVLSEIIEKNIPCRIIINDEESVHNVIPYMRSEDKVYVGLTQNIKQWQEFQKKHCGLIQVRVSHVPLLHAYFHVKKENSIVRLTYYSYNNATMGKNYSCTFDKDSPYYTLYVNEFEYLWSISDDIASM